MADNPIPLSDLAVASGSPRYVAFVEAIFKAGNIIDMFDFTKNDSLTASAFGIEESGLPTLAWGQINSQATAVLTHIKARGGWASMVRHTLQADKATLRAWNAQGKVGPGPWSIQAKGFAHQWARKFGNDLINGSYASAGVPEPLGFVGFRDMFADPSKYYIDSSCDIDCGGIDLSPSGITSTSASNFEGKLSRLLWRMGAENGDGIRLVTGVELKEMITGGQRVSNNFKTTEDRWGRTTSRFRGAQMSVAGLSVARTDILPGYETAAGAIGTDGTNKYASLFAVNMNSLYCWMGGSLNPEDLPDNGIYKERLIDALFGFLPLDNFWLGRLYDIKVRD